MVRPYKRNENDQAGQVQENTNDIQYLLQAFSGLEDRLSKIEASVGEGTDSPTNAILVRALILSAFQCFFLLSTGIAFFDGPFKSSTNE